MVKAFVKYCEEHAKQQLEKTQAALAEAQQSSNHFKMMVVKKSEFKLGQYAASSRNYAKQNIFKVDMTKCLDISTLPNV